MIYRKVSPELRQEILAWWNAKQSLGTADEKARQWKLPVTTVDAIVQEEKERLRATMKPIVLKLSQRAQRIQNRLNKEQRMQESRITTAAESPTELLKRRAGKDGYRDPIDSLLLQLQSASGIYFGLERWARMRAIVNLWVAQLDKETL